MYKKLVVPLDGSQLAEAALPHALRLARLLEAKLLLVQVVEMPMLMDGTLKAENTLLDSAEAYLVEIARSLSPYLGPDRIETYVTYGGTRYEVARIARAWNADLIVMTTHGRSGLSRIVMGSVAASVVQHTNLPVLALRPVADKPLAELLTELEVNPPKPRILVPLDKPENAEMVLKPAIELARKLNATIHLLHVVRPYIPVSVAQPWFAQHLDVAPEMIHAEAYKYLLEQADAQLARIQAEVEAKRVACVRAIREGEPFLEIGDYARTSGATMLVMATHARRLLGRILLGSVAEEVVRRNHLPVLLVHLTNHPLPETFGEEAPEQTEATASAESGAETASPQPVTALAEAPESAIVEVPAPGTLLEVEETKKALVANR